VEGSGKPGEPGKPGKTLGARREPATNSTGTKKGPVGYQP